MRKFIIGSLKWVLGIYLLLSILLYFYQDKIIFQATSLPDDFKFNFEEPFIEKDYLSQDGNKINTLFFASKGKSKGLIFYCHGNRRNLKTWGRFAESFTKNGYDVFMWDYRGFGKTKGNPSESNIFQDARVLYSKMSEKYTENMIILYGRSLGSGVATMLASENKPQQLILESSYFHLANVGERQLPIFPYAFLINHPFRTDKYIVKVKCPIHIFHGDKDELVPYESSIDLAKLVGEKPREMITILKGGGHRGLERFDEYQAKLKEILQ